MNRLFHGYAAYKGDISGRRNGVLISNDQGEAVAYAMWKLEDRGPMMIEPGWRVYRGMIVGEHTRENDLEINVLKGKQLHQHPHHLAEGRGRAPHAADQDDAGKGAVHIEDDELVEITPKSIRLRKRHLDPNERKRGEGEGSARELSLSSCSSNARPCAGHFYFQALSFVIASQRVGAAIQTYRGIPTNGLFVAVARNDDLYNLPRYCSFNWQRMSLPSSHRSRDHRRRRGGPWRGACAARLRPFDARSGGARSDRRRARTVSLPHDVIFDVGCGWLHSADKNPFVPIADRLGFAINKHRPPWQQQTFDAGFPRAEREEFIAAMNDFFERADEASEGVDSPASDFLIPGNRWNAQIDAVSTYINGCELDQVSIHDMAAYEDTEINWRVVKGYGALIAPMARRATSRSARR